MWIALSDELLGIFASDRDSLVRLGVFKGFAFVVATGALLYLILRRTVVEIERAFNALDHANAIIESTNEAIVSTTLDGRITSWNAAAEDTFGLSADQTVGTSVDNLIPDDCKKEHRELLRRVRTGDRIERFETTRLRSGDTPFPAAITVSPIRGGAAAESGAAPIVGVSQFIRDITEGRRSKAIASREQRFASTLIESLPGVFYLYDEQGTFLRWNRRFEEASGYTAEQIAGMHPLDFFAAGDRALLEERVRETFEMGEAGVEAPLLTNRGELIPYFFSGQRIELDGAACLIGLGVDLSWRKQIEDALRASEERYRTTLDTMLEGAQLLDFDWTFLYVNEAAATQNRRPAAEFLGKRMPDMWPGIEDTAVFALLRDCMTERQPRHGEIEFEFPDGSSAWFDVRAQPVREGMFVLSIDISERKEAERELRNLNLTLEKKVAERTLDLVEARHRAEAADRVKSAFLATMSHELRTPLNSILGFTGLILQGLAGPLTAEQEKQLGMVKNSARHLLELINDVLDISKIEAGQLDVSTAEFDLRDSIAKVAELITPLADEKGLALRVDVPPGPVAMRSDPRRVEQILVNLLGNAVKFTERGKVTLSLELAAGGRARIQVADTGIGMKQEDISQLFQPFRQLDSGLQRQHDGTGLGLAISRRLAELLGGAIEVESVSGQGSVFTVVLPRELEDVES